MFTSLLPGLRELRAPLAAGYVWLVGLWLAFGARVPRSNAASDAWADIYDLANWAGHAGTVVAITFVAYLLGIASLPAMIPVISVGNFVLDRVKLAQVSPGYWRSKRVGAEISDVVLTRISERFYRDESFRERTREHLAAIMQRADQGPAPDDGGMPYPLNEGTTPDNLIDASIENPWLRKSLLNVLVDVDKYVAEVEDLSHLRARLIGRDEAIYMEIDRQHGEYQFRMGLFLPLVFLFSILAVRIHPAWAAGIAGCTLLVYLGVNAAAQADLHLISMVASGRIESASIERLLKIDLELLPYEAIHLAPS